MEMDVGQDISLASAPKGQKVLLDAVAAVLFFFISSVVRWIEECTGFSADFFSIGGAAAAMLPDNPRKSIAQERHLTCCEEMVRRNVKSSINKN